MKTRDPLLVLQDALKDMEKTANWLRQSWGRCRILPAAEAASEANAEAVEAFMSRFARTVDLLANKVLRALDLVELEPSGSLLDVLNRAERRGVVASAERLREMKNLRNLIAHDYAGEYLAETFRACVEFTSQLLEIIERVRDYCERFSERQNKAPSGWLIGDGEWPFALCLSLSLHALAFCSLPLALGGRKIRNPKCSF